MKRRQWARYAVALAILVVGLAWAGVPTSALLLAGLVLVCPLMMLVMMRGIHGGDPSAHDPSHDHQQHNTADRADDRHNAGRR